MTCGELSPRIGDDRGLHELPKILREMGRILVLSVGKGESSGIYCRIEFVRFCGNLMVQALSSIWRVRLLA